MGEGGGQIVRTSLALSLITGKPFRITRVRAGRDKPGLRQQHLTAVQAAATVGSARVEGARVGANEFAFYPGEVRAGEYRFHIGTAGSTTLVLQTVLPPLMLAGSPSILTLTGGTHNAHAPPFDFLQRAFLPLIRRMGPRVELQLVRYGFYPPGGGELRVNVEPCSRLLELELPGDSGPRPRCARAVCVKLPASVAQRELRVVQNLLGWEAAELHTELSDNALSPGNYLCLEFGGECVTEVVTSLGERGVPAEQVAQRACEEALGYLAHGAPVGEHLADQLLLPFALAGGGRFLTGPLSLHTTTNMEVIAKFLPIRFRTENQALGAVQISVVQ
jgi:RNA 3'-terminal phosphate cyclase (ATP)